MNEITNRSTNLTPEYMPISPEMLEIANTYIACMDYSLTASQLGLTLDAVVEYVNKPEVQKYVTEIFLNSGYRNRFKLGATLDKIIDAKLVELEEASMTSSKDIMELLALAHKMRMEEIAAMNKHEELKQKRQPRQTNIHVETGKSKNIFETLIEDLGDI